MDPKVASLKASLATRAPKFSLSKSILKLRPWRTQYQGWIMRENLNKKKYRAVVITQIQDLWNKEESSTSRSSTIIAKVILLQWLLHHLLTPKMVINIFTKYELHVRVELSFLLIKLGQESREQIEHTLSCTSHIP